MLRRLGLLIAVPIAALVVSGCGGQVITGGGWLKGQNQGKATFGFTVNAGGQGVLKGTYHDPTADPAVSIRFTSAALPFPLGDGMVSVSWVEQGPPRCENDTAACTGVGLLYAQDNGEPGTLGTGDVVAITLLGFHGGTYTNGGAIGGGNIQVRNLSGT